MITIQDVAKAAGVSVSTVSRALNNYSDVSESTRAKIYETAKKLGYVANINARSLSSKNQTNIALIFSGFFESKLFCEFETLLMRGVYKYAYEHNLDVSTRVIDNNTQKVKNYDQLCHEFGVSGSVIFGLKTTDFYCQTLPQAQTPCVTIDLALEASKLGSVTVDNTESFRILTQHLIDMGHRKIVLIQGRKQALVTMERFSGAQMAMKTSGLSFSDDNIINTNYLEEEAYNGVIEYFKTHTIDDVTAFLCMSDLTAFGAMKALNYLGYRVPQDVSIVGYDGVIATTYITPTLTTVNQHIEEKGYAAAELLHKIIKGEQGGQKLLLPYSIQNGNSVAKPRN